MISEEIENIKKQLDDIEERYDQASPGGYDASIFALAYILILSSWIEECRTKLSCQLVDTYFDPGENAEKIKKELKRINGFKFSEHFKKAIERIVGVHGYLEIRSNCNPKTLTLLESALGFIWDIRCEAAHNTFEGLQNKRFHAPSVIKPQRDRIFAGLNDLEHSLSLIKRSRISDD